MSRNLNRILNTLPKGAVSFQPRASPWEAMQNKPTPCKGKSKIVEVIFYTLLAFRMYSFCFANVFLLPFECIPFALQMYSFCRANVFLLNCGFSLYIYHLTFVQQSVSQGSGRQDKNVKNRELVFFKYYVLHNTEFLYIFAAVKHTLTHKPI